jgi:uncharacterized protein (TIGR03086 family)
MNRLTTDIRELDRRAVHASAEMVSKASTDDLGRATPCGDWTLGDLLAHMTVQHYGFAAAARGHGGDLEVWRFRPLGDRALSAYAEAAEHVITAFAESGVLEREFVLPEFRTGPAFPAARAIGFHFIDYVVHGWDVARALDLPYALESDLLEAALPIARAVPDGPERLEPGAAFRPRLAISSGAGPMDEILALLGRPPRWPDPE